MTLDLQFYLSLILRRLPVIAAIIFTATTAGILYALSLPPVFRAEARLLIENAQIPAELAAARLRAHAASTLPASERPVADTPVLHSPILNVFIEGRFCWGNIPRPKTLGVAAIPEFERAVFDSWSTHPNPGQEWTVTGKGGLVSLSASRDAGAGGQGIKKEWGPASAGPTP